ncbi:hypothetical protein GCM10022394_17580 [Zobellella aerophila]|uniref:Uncharacterized protein n=1 Tax=Zobellella aerophila TaxID=870480 RepID=A0ABP6VRT1_9GAMM
MPNRTPPGSGCKKEAKEKQELSHGGQVNGLSTLLGILKSGRAGKYFPAILWNWVIKGEIWAIQGEGEAPKSGFPQ